VYFVQAELTRKRLERAGKLTSGLSEEGVRWHATADQLQTQIDLLIGNVFISAACIAYYGAFTGSYRWAATHISLTSAGLEHLQYLRILLFRMQGAAGERLGGKVQGAWYTSV